MSWEILLDTKPYSFTTDDLPALIHGEKDSGYLLFTASILAELYRQGHPVFLINGTTVIADEFLKQVEAQDETSTLQEETDLHDAETKQVIILPKEHISLLPQALSQLSDFWERVVVLSGIEYFSEDIIRTLKDHPNTVYSGDLNACPAKEALLQLKYSAKIFFSPLHNDYRLTLPELESQHGYFLGRISQGRMSLRSTDREQR